MDEIIGSEEFDFPEWGSNGKAGKKEKDRVTKVALPNSAVEYGRYPDALGNDRARGYLQGRGIPCDTATSCGLRYDPTQERVLVPIWDYWTGRLAGFSGRILWTDSKRKRVEAERREWLRERGNPNWKKYKIPKVRDYAGLTKRAVLLGRFEYRTASKSHKCGALWSVSDTSTWERVILVEGLFAYLRLTALGFDNVIALLGSELTPEKAAILRDIGKAVYWFVDNDLAGQQCMWGTYDHEEHIFEGNGGISMLYGDVAQFEVEWPEGKDDPDDLTRDEVESMIANARFCAKG
jgi:DNA primase